MHLGYKTYGKKAKKRQQRLNQKKKNHTIPQPFSFTERDSGKKKKTIRQRKLDEMLEENERKKMEPFQKKNRFKAKPVPEHIKQRDLYNEIKKEQNERRRKVKENSIAITLEREKPFSFYNRDKNKKGVKEHCDIDRDWEEYRFKANPIKWACSIEERA